jgi:cytochrome P450
MAIAQPTGWQDQQRLNGARAMADSEAIRGSKSCPIEFDHESVEHAENWPEEFRELRAQCPRAWTESYGGFWVATRFADIVAVAQRSDIFSTHKENDFETGACSGGAIIPPVPGIRGIPNETESPEWDGLRGFVNRRFAPRAVEERRARAQQLVAALVDEVIETGRFDIVEHLTNPLPALVTMDIFGFPLDEWRDFAEPFHKIMYTRADDPNILEIVHGLKTFRRRVDEEVAKRRIEPKDDLLTYFATGTINGEPLDHQTLQDLAFNILAGGVDTTTALTSNTLIWLSQNPGQRQRLIDDPTLLPIACEEFVRFYSPIHALARNAKKDIDLDGWHIAEGERVMLAYAAGNRDPEAFEDPEHVRIDRFPNKHIGFGAGMHRCLGSFLARMMFQVMVTEVLNRMPDYRVIEAEAVRYPTISPINGWITIPAVFTPGKKVGAVLQ